MKVHPENDPNSGLPNQNEIPLTMRSFEISDGISGRDWEEISLDNQSGKDLYITATNHTVNCKPGNTARVILKVNGVVVLDQTQDKQDCIVGHRISDGVGTYRVEAQGYNSNADAGTVTIAYKSIGPIVV
jgi:hypothetical protein